MGKLINNNTFISSIPLPSGKESPTGLPIFDIKKISVGVNIIPDSELELLKQNGFVKTQITLGKFVIEDTSVESIVSKDSKLSDIDKSIEELRNMSTKEAKKIILGDTDNLGILDINLLKKLQDIDKRRGIQTAVSTQIEILYERDEEEK